MAFITRSMFTPALMLFNAKSSSYMRFDSVWGRHTSNGVLVYNNQMDMYNGEWREDEKFKRFLISIGASHEEMISQPVDKDIERIYFKLNNNYSWDGTVRPTGNYSNSDWNTDDQKYDSSKLPVKPTKTRLTNNINNAFKIGDVIEVRIHYGGGLKRYVGSHKLEWSANGIEIISSGIDKEAIRNTLDSDKWYYYGNSMHKEYSTDTQQFQLYDGADIDMPYSTGVVIPSDRNTPVCSVSVKGDSPLGVLALLDNNISFERVDGVFDEEIVTSSGSMDDGEALSYSYTYRYIFKGITKESSVIEEADEWYNAYLTQLAINTRNYTNTDMVKSVDKGKYEYSITALSSLIKKTLSEQMYRASNDSLFYDGRIRVKEAGEMKRKDFVDMLSKNLDTDYKVKEASFWEKVVAIVIIIVVSVISWGIATGPTMVASGIAMQVASFAGAMSLGLSIGMMMLSSIGGMSTQGLTKVIGVFAEIMGYVALIAGMYAAIQSAGKRLLIEEGLKEGSKEFAEELINQSITEQITAAIKYMVKDALSGVTKALSASFTSLTKVVNFTVDGLNIILKGVSYWQEHEADNIKEEIDSNDEEIDRLQNEMVDDEAVPHPLTIMKDLKTVDMINRVDEIIYECGPRVYIEKFYSSIVTLKS